MKATLNIGKKVIAALILLVMIVGGAIGIYQQYPTIVKQSEKLAGNYFDTMSFMSTLSDGMQYLAFEASGDIMISDEVPGSVSYGSSWINANVDELDYYVKQLESEKVLERNATLLAKVFEGEEEISSKEVTSHYQFIIEVEFDESGNLQIKQVYGADEFSIKTSLEESNFFYSYQPKNVKMLLGIPKELPQNGFFARDYHYHLEDGYIVFTIPYLVLTAVIVMLIILIVPFAWFNQLAIVRGVTHVPLELRFLFVIGTIFAVMGAPFLVYFTHSGQLLELMDWYFGIELASWSVGSINLICWGGFIAVITLHALYIKEFFVIGPWQMIRRHTILGQLIWLWRRPKVVTKTVVEEKVMTQEDPRVAVMVSQLALFKETLIKFESRLNEVEGVEEVVEQLATMIQLCEFNQPMKRIDLTKLISDTMVSLEEQFILLEVKVRFPKENIFMTCHESSMKLLIQTLLEEISSDALDHSRVYLEMMCEDEQVKLITRSVLKDEANSTQLTALEALVGQQRGTLETLIDGDLMKLTITLKK